MPTIPNQSFKRDFVIPGDGDWRQRCQWTEGDDVVPLTGATGTVTIGIVGTAPLIQKAVTIEGAAGAFTMTVTEAEKATMALGVSYAYVVRIVLSDLTPIVLLAGTITREARLFATES